MVRFAEIELLSQQLLTSMRSAGSQRRYRSLGRVGLVGLSWLNTEATVHAFLLVESKPVTHWC